MKKLVKTFKLLSLAFLAVAAVSCEDDDDNGNAIDNNNSAYDLTVDNANFTILNAALLRTGLDATLDQSGGTFTVFAPTDAAFQTFLSANGFASIDDVPVAVLRNTLLNHVLGVVARSTDLTSGYVKTNATNDDGDFLDLYVDLTSGVTLNGVADVDLTMADITVDNGVVHVVDEVIALPTVATLAAANPSLSSLVAALSQEELVSAVSDPAATLTVFAPLNSSFDALITEDPLMLGWSDINDILALGNGAAAGSTLDAVLTYHVVGTQVVRAEDITDGLAPMTLQGTTFTINVAADGSVSITDNQGRTTGVILAATNITATNGVVHAIDNVLIP